MINERPTSVSVVGWFFIIIGSLSCLSALGFLVVSLSGELPASRTWIGYVQLIVAGFLAYAGFQLLKGSAFMRQALEIASYALVLLIVVYGARMGLDFRSWFTALIHAIYLIPFVFVIRALRSEKVKTFVSEKHNKPK